MEQQYLFNAMSSKELMNYLKDKNVKGYSGKTKPFLIQMVRETLVPKSVRQVNKIEHKTRIKELPVELLNMIFEYGTPKNNAKLLLTNKKIGSLYKKELLNRLKNYKISLDKEFSIYINTRIIHLKLDIFTSLKKLIEKGADANLLSNKGNNVLQLCLQYLPYNTEFRKLFKFFIEYVNVNHKDKSGNDSLLLLVKRNELSFSSIKSLIDKGANIITTNNRQEICIFKILEKYLLMNTLLAAQFDSFLCHVLENIPDVNICNKMNKTLLMYATEKGCLNSIKILHKRGVFVNKTDNYNNNALFFVNYNIANYMNIIEYLVEECCINIDCINIHNRVPISIPLVLKKYDVVKYFFQKGANSSLIN